MNNKRFIFLSITSFDNYLNYGADSYYFKMKPLYSISKKLLMSNYKRLSSPCKITFAITYACTFLCKTCNIGRNYLANPKKTKEGELSYEEIGNIFKKSKPSWIQITGGEPFMRDVY